MQKIQYNPEALMQYALQEAYYAAEAGEVPVGAVVATLEGEVLSSAHNKVETQNDPSAHAEVLAIQKAAAVCGGWRLDNCVLCVTLEPCTMCTGAIKLSRIQHIIFGTEDPRAGAMGSIYDLSLDDRSGPAIKVYKGIQEEACRKILQNFFNARRKNTV